MRLALDEVRPAFTCGDPDLDEFFHKDSMVGGNELVTVTYLVKHGDDLVGFFSVSNDSVRREDTTPSRYKKITRDIPRQKRFKTLPAVKTGRLGIAKETQKNKVGTTLMNFIKAWFVANNKTGCRFILVDAYANTENSATGFYEKNGFRFLTHNDEGEDTRLMYFDLITLVRESLIRQFPDHQS
ncbi:MAG: GNAT family N-acetyltransferase [Proteobacteria bacterium]|nr:GNAT family N-acetyltransferase [Pseudomonadota bacterium]